MCVLPFLLISAGGDNMPETTSCEYVIRAHQLCTALNNAMMFINSSLDVQEILQRIVEETGKAIGSESARIAMREEDK